MKNQKALLASEWHKAPDIEIEPFNIYKSRYSGNIKVNNYLYRCGILEGGELVLTVFKANKTPLFRSIMDRNGLKSQYYEDNKVSNSTIGRYLSDVLHFQSYYNAKIETDEESREIVNKWLKDNLLVPLKSSETPLEAVKQVQAQIRRKEVERRNEKIRKSIDDNMLDIRPVPKRIGKWVDDVVLKESRYILYKYSGRKLQDGACTHCKTKVKVADAKNGGYGKCPNCRSKIKYIARGRAPISFRDEARYTYIQPDKNGDPIFRYFEVTRCFQLCGDVYLINDYTQEQQRYFYGKNKKYIWDNFRQTGEYRFCDTYSITERWGAVYPYNMKAVLKNIANIYPHVKYIPMTKMLNSMTESINPHHFYTNVAERPVIEYLAKLRLYTLCSEAINGYAEKEWFNPDAERFKDVFPKGATRDELRFFAKLDLSSSELNDYYKTRGVKRERFEEGLKFVREEVISRQCIKYLKYTSFQKLARYLETINRRYTWNDCVPGRSNDWADYIELAEKCKWDMKNDSVLFPKDFWEAHDRADKLAKLEEVKKLDGAVARCAKVLNAAYKMEGKEYFIRAAANAQEIVAEGQALHHCVARYAERVAKGETGILFMRSVKDPEKPLYTIEVRDGEIIQCRGKNNRDMDKKEEKTFYSKWKNAKVKKTERKAG